MDYILERTTLFETQDIECSVHTHNNVQYLVIVYDDSEYIPFPVQINVSFRTEVERDISEDDKIIIKDKQDNYIGAICLATAEIAERDMFPERYVAFYADANELEIVNKKYLLKKAYLIISKNGLENYIEHYKNSSILWGGFYHEDDKVVEDARTQVKTAITCLPNLELPTPFHKVSAQEAILHLYPFERFLKNYQLLELLFDYQTVEEIIKARALATDRNKYNKSVQILKDYDKNSKEIDRLNYIIEKNLIDLSHLVTYLDNVKLCVPLAREIFFEYGKDSNPDVKDKEGKILFDTGISHNFSERSFQYPSGDNMFTKRNTTYEKFIKKMISYWIYRIRCCIAHNKIGDFSLSPSNIDHQKFMIDFAEPLLQEVLIQCFTR